MTLQDPIIGKKLGDYTIQELLGRGGMARVYKGYDQALDRYAAVKVITSEFVATADEAEYKARFQREARAIARLRHANIVGIYQFGDLEGLYYMAMVFLDGVDLRVELKHYHDRDQRMPFEQILKMAREVASALDYAHTQGVIHRDIKPSNIMMTSTGATLTDFGLALTMAEGTMGDTFGSAHYIAPEQAISSAKAVPQSDLYSLGVVLYEAFAGKVPFDDPSVMSVALKHLNEPPPPPTLFNPTLPKELEKVLFKALNKDPKDRYHTGRELVEALEKALAFTEDDTVELRSSSLATKETPVSDSLASYLNVIKAPAAATTAEARATSDLRPASSPPEIPPATPPFVAERPAAKAQLASKLPLVLAVVAMMAVIAGVGGLLLSGGDDGSDSRELAAADRTETAVAALPTVAATEAPSATAYATATPTQAPSATPTWEPSPTATAPEPSATPTRQASATATVAPTGAASASATVQPSEVVVVVQPSATPTRRLSATPRPSNTPAPTSTPTAPVSPTPSEPPEIQLRYTTQRFLLENISSVSQDISALVFEGDEIGRYAAESWRDELARINGAPHRILSRGCLQLVTDTDAVLTDTPPIGDPCFRFSVWEQRTDAESHFWITNEGNTKFVVKAGDTVIAECPLAARVVEETICEFALP
jgi:serine/threonine protein kinase